MIRYTNGGTFLLLFVDVYAMFTQQVDVIGTTDTHSTFFLFYNLHVISLRLVESPPRYRLIASSYVNCYGSSFSHNTTQPNSSHRFLLYTAFNTDKYFISVGSISVECTEITLSS